MNPRIAYIWLVLLLVGAWSAGTPERGYAAETPQTPKKPRASRKAKVSATPADCLANSVQVALRGAADEPPLEKVGIEGSDRTALLAFSPNLQKLFRQFKQWETTLESRGIQATFYIGAGDLRRALLQMPMDGPGDVELFIHVHNRTVHPHRLADMLRFLKNEQVDVESGFHAIFGDKKKIDAFAKDEWALRENMPYYGMLGFFDNMGDTSLNRLLYSPKKNRIEGIPEDLAALAQGKIVFTEPDKAQPLAEPKKITGGKNLTHYKPTILRLALRNIRLQVDLLLSRNRNGLVMDKGFDDVLRGFELYFKHATEPEIRQFALDDTYIEQFLKVFRDRTPEQLAKIHSFLSGQHPETLRILKLLGLDVDFLCQAPDKVLTRDERELKAVVANSYFDELRPFVDPTTLEVQNPFTHPARFAKIIEMSKLKGVDPAKIVMIPNPVLERLSAKLASFVEHFGQLDLPGKLWTVQNYVSNLKLVSKAAKPRLLDESTFADKHYQKFPEVDPLSLDPKDGRSLLEVLTEGILKPFPREGTLDLREFNQPTVDAITQAVRAQKEATVFVDLDDVVFSYPSRVSSLLRKYDQQMNHLDSRRFGNLRDTDVPSANLEEFLYQYLRAGGTPGAARSEKPIAEFQKLQKAVKDIKEFVELERFGHDAVRADKPNPTVVEMIKQWANAGARIVYVTARKPNSEPATRDALKAAGLPIHGLAMVGEVPGSISKSKAAAIRDYTQTHPGTTAVAFLDNDRTTVEGVQKELPEVPTYRVLTKVVPPKDHPSGKDRIFENYLTTPRLEDFYRVHRKIEAPDPRKVLIEDAKTWNAIPESDRKKIIREIRDSHDTENYNHPEIHGQRVTVDGMSQESNLAQLKKEVKDPAFLKLLEKLNNQSISGIDPPDGSENNVVLVGRPDVSIQIFKLKDGTLIGGTVRFQQHAGEFEGGDRPEDTPSSFPDWATAKKAGFNQSTINWTLRFPFDADGRVTDYSDYQWEYDH